MSERVGRNRGRSVCVAAVLAFGWGLVPGFALTGIADARETTILQLPWYHQFQFAGFYAAEKRGYYEDAGLDVQIRAAHGDPDGDSNPVAAVVLGQADFGVARSDLLIHHAQGLPVTVLANIFQRSAFKMMTLERYGIEELADLDNQPICFMFTDQERGTVVDAEALVALLNAGLDPEALNTHEPTWELEELKDGTTQLMPGYATDKAFLERRLGELPVFISPRDYDTDFYGELLFTSATLVRDRPEYVEAFREASLRGWHYAMNNPESVIDWLLANYSTRSPEYDREMLLAEAEAMREYVRDDLVEIGHINPERWRRIAEDYRRLGLVGEVDWDEFLYQTDPAVPSIWPKVAPWLAGSGAVLALLAAFSFWLWSTNRRLVVQLRQREETTENLRVQAEEDSLTGLGNRRQMERRAENAVHEAREAGSTLGCLVLDVDRFKELNDRYGHLAGDQVLVAVAERLRERTRGGDLLFRYGGEEFVILTPGSPRDAALELAERIREEIQGTPFPTDTTSEALPVTVSLGVAVLEPSDPNFFALLERADSNLYAAKRRGRNRVVG